MSPFFSLCGSGTSRSFALRCAGSSLWTPNKLGKAVETEQRRAAACAWLATGPCRLNPQFFGEGCLAGQSLRTTTMSALGNCQVTSITRAAMIAALNNQPRFSRLFMDHLLRRNSRIQEDVINQLFNSSERRLARLLLLLANYGKEGGPPIVPVILGQETLADMIGTTRSRVSFFMNKFRKLGLIDYKQEIDVHPSLLNAVLHDKPEIGADEPA
ncbi:MAG TPA: Crp/Fnr family transcriptional regulator [Bradyrhizobium sp.]|nr:Crp/Fnr family transcriptional regulator [Bradyrhizobium sp.]